MRKSFTESAAPLTEAEQALTVWGIKFEKHCYGAILVREDLDIANRGLTKLPDLSSVTVAGNFSCHSNQLTSLEGAPQTVGGNFYCGGNQLTSLKHTPRTIIGDFDCRNNQLTSLKDAPQTVGGDFFCNGNQLTSLKGAPQAVSYSFNCNDNQLMSLEGAPRTVGGGFYCCKNQLTSLEGAPQSVGEPFFDCNNNPLVSLEGAPTTFKRIASEFGEFSSWEEVPESLRMSPQTKARAAEQAVRDAVVLQRSLRMRAPLKLKRGSASCLS